MDESSVAIYVLTYDKINNDCDRVFECRLIYLTINCRLLFYPLRSTHSIDGTNESINQSINQSIEQAVFVQK